MNSIPKFVLADVDKETSEWRPEILKIPVLGSVQSVLVAFNDYVVGQELIDKFPAAAGSELVAVNEEEFKNLCRRCVEIGVEIVLTYIMAESNTGFVYLTAGTATYVE
jgi:hypothetical protein